MNIGQLILEHLSSNSQLNTLNFAKNHNVDHQLVIGALKSLEANEKIVSTVKSYRKLVTTEEGSQVAQNGSYEYNLYSQVPTEGIAMDALVKLDVGSLGFSKAMSLKWIRREKQLVFKNTEIDSDRVREDMKMLEKGDWSSVEDGGEAVKEYKRRKLVKEVEVKYFEVERGPAFSPGCQEDGGRKLVSVVSKEIVAAVGDDCDSIDFKPLNLAVGGVRRTNANLHPLLKVRHEYKNVFIEMGFQEMPTNNFVESSFWNFDALFQPQDHPARDAHDTFFVSCPATSDKFPSEYLHRVQQVHSQGGYGSQGYKTPWRVSEAQKNLLRTHTTAVSARMLYSLAQQEHFEPVKFFSIDRVFRNETLDATHLAEFHQVEGLVADRGLSLGHLQMYIRRFFSRIGLERLKFKPAYNPYTEPSMEVFGYHEGLRRWIELGNSGIFRPEMLLPMGLPEDVVVIAWGLSLERPTMIKYGYNDIRDLMGPKIDLKMVYDAPLCRLDKKM